MSENGTQELSLTLKSELPVKAQEYKKEIASLREKAADLTLTDVTDKVIYEAIKRVRIEAKTMRVGVSKYCKADRDKVNDYLKANLSKEKEIVAEITEIEERLELEETKYTDEIARLQRVEEEKIQARTLDRCAQLEALGATYKNPITLRLLDCEITMATLQESNDINFGTIKGLFLDASNKVKIAAEEEARIEEEERLNREAEQKEYIRKREEQEAIAKEQKRIADEQAKKEREMAEREEKLRKEEQARLDAIQAEKDRQEREIKEAAEKEQRAKELKEAEEKAAAKAIQDLKDKEEADRLAKIEKEKADAEREAKRLARQPDKKRLVNCFNVFLHEIDEQKKVMELKATDCNVVFINTMDRVSAVFNEAKKEIEKL